MRTCEELIKSDEVAQRLAHLCTVYGNHVVMHPIFDHVMPHSCHALGNLTLMVWKYKVHTASMDIKLLAKVLAAHCSTLTVPTWETVAPGRWPAHDMLGLCTLPQCEIRRITFLLLTVEFTRSVEHIIKITAGQDTVVMVLVILCHIKIY